MAAAQAPSGEGGTGWFYLVIVGLFVCSGTMQPLLISTLGYNGAYDKSTPPPSPSARKPTALAAAAAAVTTITLAPSSLTLRRTAGTLLFLLPNYVGTRGTVKAPSCRGPCGRPQLQKPKLHPLAPLGPWPGCQREATAAPRFPPEAAEYTRDRR